MSLFIEAVKNDIVKQIEISEYNVEFEKEMKERIKEIDTEKARLSKEKAKYEKYFYEKEKRAKENNHKNYLGRCFLINSTKNNTYDYIKAFKIINVLEAPNQDYAECIVIIDGYRDGMYKECGVLKMVVGVWTQSILTMISNDTIPKVIDLYKEIDSDEFSDLFTKYCCKL